MNFVDVVQVKGRLFRLPDGSEVDVPDGADVGTFLVERTGAGVRVALLDGGVVSVPALARTPAPVEAQPLTTPAAATVPAGKAGAPASVMRSIIGWFRSLPVLRGRWVWVAAAGAALVLVVVAVLVVALAGKGTQSSTVAAPSPTLLPVASPAGWESAAAWSVPAGASAAVPVVGPDGSLVMAADQELRALDPGSGALRWSVKLPAPVTSLMFTEVDGQQVIAATDGGTSLSLVSADGSSVETLETEVKTGAKIVLDPSGPYAVLPTKQAMMVTDGKWVTRPIPAGATPVGVSKNALIAVDGSGKAWSITSDTETAAPSVGLPVPQGAGKFSKVLGFAGGPIVTAWQPKATLVPVPAAAPAKASKAQKAAALKAQQVAKAKNTAAQAAAAAKVIISVTKVDDGKFSLIRATQFDASSLKGSGFLADPAGRVAIIGGLIVDLTTGTVHAAPVSQMSVGGGYAWGPAGAKERVRIDRTGKSVPLNPAAPTVLLVLPDGKALVKTAATEGSKDQSFYALTPANNGQKEAGEK